MTVPASPPPADGVGSATAELAARIRATTFPRIRYRSGYDSYDVDWLLRRVATALERGTATPALADELAEATFSTTKIRSGYDERTVDEFVDEVVSALRAVLGPTPPVTPKRSPLGVVRGLFTRR